MTATYFPEPDTPDPTWGQDDERPVDWLRRSTHPRAVSLRAALNENLGQFEPKHAVSLAKKLRADWKSHYFELIVGRWLQEIGGSVEHEPLGANGTRIDFRARFVDGEVCVEAVAKRMNLYAVPGRGYVDNSEQRIRRAFRDPDKRGQATGANAPAILAIDGGVLGARLNDFDSALLGNGVMYLGLDHEKAGNGFNAMHGDMSKDTASPWAGVLAFLQPGVFSAQEPVLYISPHFTGHLPLATLNVRRRLLATTDFPGSGDRPMDRIRFADPLTDE